MDPKPPGVRGSPPQSATELPQARIEEIAVGSVCLAGCETLLATGYAMESWLPPLMPEPQDFGILSVMLLLILLATSTALFLLLVAAKFLAIHAVVVLYTRLHSKRHRRRRRRFNN